MAEKDCTQSAGEDNSQVDHSQMDHILSAKMDGSQSFGETSNEEDTRLSQLPSSDNSQSSESDGKGNNHSLELSHESHQTGDMDAKQRQETRSATLPVSEKFVERDG
jgi:hypothetical protein